MSSALYRKYRPQRFSELVGQGHVAKAFQNAISEGRLSHSYLFSGTRGTGKTSTARILGATINCEKFVDGFPSAPNEVEPCGECDSCLATKIGNSFDVIELDAASNNGVDDMRELIEKVSYTTASGRTKVYIIDEVHELTGRASNALLKTLEEPPDHVVFILATTNPEKVLPTIRSRTQHFEFVSPTTQQLFGHAKEILALENKELDDDVVRFVVQKGAGSVRDMLSYLDQVLALNVSTMEELSKSHATNDTKIILELIVYTKNNDVACTMKCIEQLLNSGKEPRAVIESIIVVARDCLVLYLNPDTSIFMSNYPNRDDLTKIGNQCGIKFLQNFILTLGKAVSNMRSAASLNPQLTMEIALLSCMNEVVDNASPSLSARVEPVKDRFEDVSPTSTASNELSQEASSLTVEVSHNESVTVKPSGRSTLGALKKSEQPKTQIASTEAKKKTSTKLTIQDIQASWSKVVALLSVASQASIKKTQPTKLVGDVIYFQAPESELDEIKQRFKKDANIIRGFLESIHGRAFKFQIEAVRAQTSEKGNIDIRETIQDEEISLDDSVEYDAVENVVSLFSGEVVQDKS